MASNEVKFSLKIEDNATGTLKDVSASTKDLGSVVKNVTQEVSKAQREIVDWAQAAQAADMLGQSIRQIEGVCRDLTDTYQVQLVAETQLQTVMRQRMKATDEEIQAVKELCSAQQQLGVIGDEVQLSGAQQMATFLSEKASLDALVPAMNNLLAQQKGLNATNQDAVAIGNMMGKAMQGQVDVLQRVGITFTEAQKQVLKYGNESQRAAMLAEVIRDNVGEMNAELAKTDAGKQKQLENTLGDLKEQLGAMVQPAMRTITALAQLSVVVTGALKVRATIHSLSASMQLTTQTATLFKASTTSLNALLTVLRARMSGAAVGATTLKVALRGLMISSGVGVAIAALLYALEQLTGRSDEAAGAMEHLNLTQQQLRRGQESYTQAASQARAEIEVEMAALQQLIKSQGDESTKINELNSRYGEAFGQHKTAAEWYDILTQKSSAYCQAIGYEAQARALATQQAENELRLQQIRQQKAQMERDGKATTVKQNFLNFSSSVGSYSVQQAATTVETEAYRQLRLEEARLVIANDQLKKSFQTCTQRMAESHVELKTLTETAADPITPEVKLAEGSIASLEKQLKELTDRQNAAPVEKQLELTADIVQLEQTLRTLRERISREKFSVHVGTPDPRLMDARTDRPAGVLGGISSSVTNLKLQPLEIDIEQPLTAMQQWDEAMRRARESSRETTESLSAIGSAFGQLGQAIGGQTGQWLQWGAGVLSAIATAIPQITALTTANELEAQSAGKAAAAEGAKAVAGIPLVGPALAVAAVAGIVASLLAIPKFANGAIAYGPTLGLFGEYAGASTNPEVVAPLDRLRQLIEPQGGPLLDGDVRFRIDGDVLMGILERRHRRLKRG